MTAILMERRAQREKEEAAHREELRRQAQVAKQKVQEAMNAELAVRSKFGCAVLSLITKVAVCYYADHPRSGGEGAHDA